LPKLRKPKSNRQKLIKQNDDLLRQIIRLRDKVCQRSGRRENLQVCHFFTRSNVRVRWELDNVCLLNGGVHLFWAHKNPQDFCEFWLKRLGKRRFDILNLKARFVAPVKEFDLICINERLKRELSVLQKS
jgi:5-methylcytosine-specific restriction endonuclease McrA